MGSNLRDSENGKIDRRQVLQRLGLVAAGAFASSAFPRNLALAAGAAQSAGQWRQGVPGNYGQPSGIKRG